MIPEGWVHIRPSKVIQLFGGGAFSSSDAQNDGIRWLKIANVGIGRIKWKDESFLPPNFRDKFSQYLLQAPDIVVALTRPTLNNKLKLARMSKNDGIALLNQRVAKVISSKEVNDDFIYQLLRTDEIAYRINASLLGTDPPNLSIKVLDEFWVSLPPLPEQKKIAQILTTWDKAIETVEKLIANSQQKKKALMQQLLTGKKRFPGFDGEWKEVRLGDVVSISTGASKTKYIDENGERFIIDMGSISRDGKLIPSKRTNYAENYLTKGQLVMPKDDIGGGFIIGRVGYIDKNNQYILGDHVYALTINDQDSLFMSYFINGEQVNKALRRKANGTAQLGLGRRDVEKQNILIPPSIEEQQKIASVLSASDQEIEIWQQELEHLKQEKKSLMQQLLTGKRRVKVD